MNELYFFLEKKKDAYIANNGIGLSPAPHLHTHIEIVMITEGKSRATADEKSEAMSPGDIFISFPNQVHYYIDEAGSAGHKLLIISPDMCPEFKGIFKSMIPESPIMKNAAENKKIVSAIDTIIDCKSNRPEYAEAEIRGSMLVLMSEICRSIKLIEKPSCNNETVKDIINYCYENYESDISLQSVAESLFISKYYVSRIFTKRLHIGFNDYINSLRIRKACELLKSGDDPITEIACQVGYSSPRTFNRCFMNIHGMTPKEYRHRAHKSKTR